MSKKITKKTVRKTIRQKVGRIHDFEEMFPTEVTPSEKKIDQVYSQWSSSDNRIFVPTSHTVDRLVPGVYEIKMSQSGVFFERISVRTENLIRFPDTKSNRVVEEVQKFWDRESVFREYNITYKRGIILHGPPGSGKSSTIQLIMKDVVERGGVVLQFQEPYVFIDGYRKLKQIQPDAPIVVIMEDLDALLDMHNETEILNLLDGSNEVDKTLFLATTNYPDLLQPRIMNRPSRFDKRFKIGFPSPESREVYFNHLIGVDRIKELDIDLPKWVEDTEEMSLAHLKELFVAVVIIGDDYKEAIKNLKKMKEPIENKDFDNAMGFNSTTNYDYD